VRSAAILLGLLLSLGGVGRAAMVDRVAAVVNDDVVTLSQIYDLGGPFIEDRVTQTGGDPYARRAAELEVLDQIIMRRLIDQETSRLGLDVTDDDVAQGLQRLAQQNGLTVDQLRSEVERQGLVWVDYRNEFKENLRQQKFTVNVIYPRIKVDEDELKDAYRRMIQGSNLPEVMDVGAIFLAWPLGADDAAKQAVRDRAVAAANRVRAGEPFASVAKEVDEGPYGANGGLMGTFHKGELLPELDGPLEALQPGGVTEPIDMPQGVFLLGVLARHTEDARPFEEVREQVFNQVYASRVQDETVQWYEQQKRKAAISIKLESPPAQ